MKILALESTSKTASVALCEDDKLLFESTSENGYTHSESLLTMALHAFEISHINIGDIGLFCCTTGPGSFTGVRIAAAVLKGLAFAGDRPCVGISTLQSLSRNLSPLPGIYVPVMDARRNQVYNAIFSSCDGYSAERMCEDRAVSLDALCAELKEKHMGSPIYLCGDGYGMTRDYLEEHGVATRPTPASLINQRAYSTALCALDEYRHGRYTDSFGLMPTYLRMPQAERERAEKEKLRTE